LGFYFLFHQWSVIWHHSEIISVNSDLYTSTKLVTININFKIIVQTISASFTFLWFCSHIFFNIYVIYFVAPLKPLNDSFHFWLQQTKFEKSILVMKLKIGFIYVTFSRWECLRPSKLRTRECKKYKIVRHETTHFLVPVSRLKLTSGHYTLRSLQAICSPWVTLNTDRKPSVL
jgi:hypothetical protein